MRISVKAVEGRIARTSPDGPFIPSDQYVNVEKTPYITRLLDFHGDIELEPVKAKKTTAAKAPPKAPAATADEKETS